MGFILLSNEKGGYFYREKLGNIGFKLELKKKALSLKNCGVVFSVNKYEIVFFLSQMFVKIFLKFFLGHDRLEFFCLLNNLDFFRTFSLKFCEFLKFFLFFFFIIFHKFSYLEIH